MPKMVVSGVRMRKRGKMKDQYFTARSSSYIHKSMKMYYSRTHLAISIAIRQFEAVGRIIVLLLR